MGNPWTLKTRPKLAQKSPKKSHFSNSCKVPENAVKKSPKNFPVKNPEKFRKNPVVTSQVTRKGHRPLSTLLSGTKVDKNEDSDDSDSEQERKLLRSQINKSFWEQHDQEEDPEVGETENNSVAAR